MKYEPGQRVVVTSDAPDFQKRKTGTVEGLIKCTKYIVRFDDGWQAVLSKDQLRPRSAYDQLLECMSQPTCHGTKVTISMELAYSIASELKDANGIRD